MKFFKKAALVALAASTSLALAFAVYVLLEERKARRQEDSEPTLSAEQRDESKKPRKSENQRLRARVERALAAVAHPLSADASVALVQEVLSKLVDVDENDESDVNNDDVGFPGLGEGEKIDVSALNKIGILGTGGFGVVVCTEATTTGKSYAVKLLAKQYLEKSGMTQNLVSERLLLVLARSPFVVHYHCAFNMKREVALCMEPLLGGEVYRTYKNKGLHGNVELAKFICACVALATEHLHRLNIVRRDAKPEDICFDQRGYVKIVDLGLAKLIVSKTFTTCGTPDYFCPELIKAAGHDWAVDAWCLGVLLFELLAGNPPFEANYPMQVYSKVMKGIGNVTFPPAAKGAESLVRAMLDANPKKRLTSLDGGWKGFQSHSYYHAFDWDALRRGAMPSPHVPDENWRSNLAQVKDEAPPTKDSGTSFPYVAHFGPVVDRASFRE